MKLLFWQKKDLLYDRFCPHDFQWIKQLESAITSHSSVWNCLVQCWSTTGGFIGSSYHLVIRNWDWTKTNHRRILLITQSSTQNITELSYLTQKRRSTEEECCWVMWPSRTRECILVWSVPMLTKTGRVLGWKLFLQVSDYSFDSDAWNQKTDGFLLKTQSPFMLVRYSGYVMFRWIQSPGELAISQSQTETNLA